MTDSDQGAESVPNEEEKDEQLMFGASDRIELISTIALAIATILTAWSAFQAGKWSGTQAINFSEAGAARTESTRADTRAGQLTQIDVAMYIDWVTAISSDINNGDIILDDASAYEPTRGTVSGFLYQRFREEFAPAVDAWLATDPIGNPDAPPTPFAMVDENGDPIVTNELAEEANRLTAVADAKAADARTANQNGDNYVLTMVLFASVLFFAGVSSKLVRKRNRLLALGFGVVLLVVGAIIIISLPIHPI
ncbi:MAG: hypothetical protein ACR2N9_10205 [Acidimicrobiia bacterium]